MRTLILLALTAPVFAHALHSGREPDNCSVPKASLEECAYKNKKVLGDQFKSVCEVEIKGYIKSYQIYGCGPWAGYADSAQRLSLPDSVNRMVHSGRYRDEINAESERKRKEAIEAQQRKEKEDLKNDFDGLKINN